MPDPEVATLVSLSSQDLFAISGVVFLTGAAGIVATSSRLARGRRLPTPKLFAADSGILDAPVVRDGALLHQQVPMERWCVTFDDLRQFKRLVQRAVAEGHILPTEADPFDPNDTCIGPCIRTVNAQFIVPATKEAGGASWALMQHPEGLPCDLFVTHGWAEGTYEFLDKVLHSWPGGARHAYCCMLSNPQNLDISSLVVSPIDSPFAKALRKATNMLVVPNRTGSIYTRLWCAYEAFLGYTWGKLITTASAPMPKFWLSAFQGQCVSLLGLGMGVASGAVGYPRMAGYLSLSGTFLLSCLWWVFLRTRPASAVLRCLQFAVEFTSGVWFGSSTLMRVPLDLLATPPPLLVQLLVMCISIIAVPCALETDRRWEVQAAEQARQLRSGFTGRLQDAQCSVPADRDRIRQELASSGSEAAVDDAVNVLICMGMSSPQLREAVARAGVFFNVGRWSRALVLGISVHVPLQLTAVGQPTSLEQCGSAWLPGLVVLGAVLWIALFLGLPRDHKAFAAASQLMILPILIALIIEAAGGHSACARVLTLMCLLAVIIMLSMLGPARVARLPLLGPALVRLLLGDRRCTTCAW